MDKLRHTLDILVDCDVFAFIPMLRKDAAVSITIRNVESCGVWIENKDLSIGVRRSPTESFQALEGLPATVCFIPWQQIGYILAEDAPDIRKRQLLHFSPKSPTDQKE
jgi:hypothetical protein